MSTITSKEKNMLMITLVLVLYAVAALCYKGQKLKWGNAKQKYRMDNETYLAERDLIRNKAEWDDKYTQMCALMPIFPYDKDVDTHWLNIMDTVASENDLGISRRQTGKEEEVGDVYELPVECKNWEGSLESLVTFLYGLRREGAMLDVRQLYIRPSTKPGFLKGTFSLNCAYMRGDIVVSGVDELVLPVAPSEPPANEKAVSSDKVGSLTNNLGAVTGDVKKTPVAVKTGSETSTVAEELDEEAVVKAALDALSVKTP